MMAEHFGYKPEEVVAMDAEDVEDLKSVAAWKARFIDEDETTARLWERAA